MTKNTVHLEELPYRPDSDGYFERLRALPDALWLDSCHPHSRRGRFDILLADPSTRYEFFCTESTTYEDVFNFFQELGKALEAVSGAQADTLPFCGGLAGYLDYDVGLPLQYLPPAPGARARVNRYDWALVQDHLLGRCLFVALPTLTATARNTVLERLREPRVKRSEDFTLEGRFESNMELAEYEAAFRQVHQYIHAGDCYQVNLARRFSAPCRGSAWQAYLRLRPLAAAPFSAFMDCGDHQLLCLSPERFLRLSGQHVETRPIKGTRPRSTDPGADAEAAGELQRSVKDRAENLMIVDLLRNDIGRNCRTGSVQVDQLFELESYPSVHHLVSTISGELRADGNAMELLRDSFPGGSITGAPKRRAMEIIRELEPHGRRAYCGSLFYASNIAIRTLLCERDQMYCWGGGGLVADSDWQQEYQETWDKIGRFIEALEQS